VKIYLRVTGDTNLVMELSEESDTLTEEQFIVFCKTAWRGAVAMGMPDATQRSLVITKHPVNKIQCIKILREHLGYGLKDTKDQIDQRYPCKIAIPPGVDVTQIVKCYEALRASEPGDCIQFLTHKEWMCWEVMAS
jgi:ribosomal protein L7/L12